MGGEVLQRILPKKNYGFLTNTFFCFVIYCLLLTACGFYFHGTSIAYYGPLAICVYLIFNQSRCLSERAFKTGMLLCAFAFVGSLLAGDEIRSILQVWAVVFTGVVVVSTVPKEKFVENYCKTMSVLCVTSTIIFFVALVAPNAVKLFPRINAGTARAYFMGFSFVRPATRWVAMRNQSIFWEPGCFQTFIILAFIFEVSRYGDKRRPRVYSYIVALITTMSTTGFLALFVAVLIWLFEENNKKKSKGLKFAISLCFFLILATSIFSFLPKGFSNGTFDKINDIINGKTDNISVTTRINAVVYSLKSFLESPLFGVGRSGLSKWGNLNESGASIMTFTPGNWLGRYGVVFGFTAILGLVQWKDKLFETKIANLLQVLIMILIVSSEAYTTNAVIWIFVFYGLYPRNRYWTEKNEERGEK